MCIISVYSRWYQKMRASLTQDIGNLTTGNNYIIHNDIMTTIAVKAALYMEEFLTRKVTQRQHTRVSRLYLLVSLTHLTTTDRTTMTLTTPTTTESPHTHTISRECSSHCTINLFVKKKISYSKSVLSSEMKNLFIQILSFVRKIRLISKKK